MVGTFDGSKISLYVNGRLYDTVAYSGHYTAPHVELRIGLESYYNTNSWGGQIDDLRIYNRSLVGNEVSALSHNTPIDKGLLGHWTFDENLDDRSGNKNDATLRIQAVSMTFAPDGRIFFTEKRTGEIRIMKDDRVLDAPFAKISGLYNGDHEGLLGITLDPKFEENHYVYVYLTYEDKETHTPFNGVLRFVDYYSQGKNVTVLLDGIPADIDGNFAGGALAFGTDDKLYVTVGMGSSPNNSQNVSSLVGKILRINRDGSIPNDNSFPNSPVYTLGHRNMYGIEFDKSGTGIVTENGDTHFDELNLIQKAGNYGFPASQYPTQASIETGARFTPPLIAYDRVIAPAQAIFYTGNKYPELRDSFIFVSYNDGTLHSVRINEKKNNQTYVDDLVIDFKHDLPDNTASVAQSPSGDLYLGRYNIYKVESISPLGKQKFLPIGINLTRGVDIKDIQLVVPEKSLQLHVGYNQSSSGESKGSISLMIPSNLLNHINSVSAEDESIVDSGIDRSLVSFKIIPEDRSGTILIKITLERTADMIIFVMGTGSELLT